MSSFQLGIVEGFYGQPWSSETRAQYARFLAASGYSFYIYAPKADPYFRKKWREPVPAKLVSDLRRTALACRESNVRFGIGLSPYEIYLGFDTEAKQQLLSRIQLLNELRIDILAILFDDMKSGPELAETQAEILHWVAGHSNASELMMCPTYYSLDPILDQLFGVRPADYLETLGRTLDPRIGVFWTGDQICSKAYAPEHIRNINEMLQRKVVLWDNYPVNDGPKMCKFLHLNSFEGRPQELSTLLSRHAINPMNQPELSKIPVLTLKTSYEFSSYVPEAAFTQAAAQVCGDSLARRLRADLSAFQKQGLDRLSESDKAQMIARYSEYSHPCANEVVDWLQGKYAVTREVFLTQ